MIEQAMHGTERVETVHVTLIRDRLEPAVRELARVVQERLPGATVTTHLLATASFPWWAVVSVCRSDGAREEIAVLDVAYWRNPNRCQLSCDLSTGSGAIVSELPERAYDSADLGLPELEDWIEATRTFLAGAVDTAVAYVRERGL